MVGGYTEDPPKNHETVQIGGWVLAWDNTVYESIVQPHHEYALLWDLYPQKDVKPLKGVQKLCCTVSGYMYVYSKNCDSSYEDLLDAF